MKSFKIIALVICSIFFGTTLMAQKDNPQVLLAQFKALDIEEIHLLLNVELTYETTNQSTIKAEIEIQSNITGPAIKKFLLRQNRYHLKPHYEGNRMSLSMPKIQKIITVNGTRLMEKVSIKVYIPKGIKIIQDKSYNDLVNKDNEKNFQGINRS